MSAPEASGKINEGTYSPLWFATFLDTIDPVQTMREVEFVARQLPLATHARLLDLCCGPGRHAKPLAARGYSVVGTDVSARALEQAHNGATALEEYVELDLRALDRLRRTFDGVLLLWQSFGQFDDATNAAVLRDIAARLRPGGRLVLDIYHRAFFVRHLGERAFERLGRRIVEHKVMHGDRLTVEIDYGAGAPRDRFEWQIFTPDELCERARSVGLHRVLACASFDEATPAGGEQPRFQVVLENAGS